MLLIEGRARAAIPRSAALLGPVSPSLAILARTGIVVMTAFLYRRHLCYRAFSASDGPYFLSLEVS
jgi:hypothetical protein